MKKLPILEDGDVVPAQIVPPAPKGAALFYTARWHVWRVGGVPTLFERRPIKARRRKIDRPHIVHYDTVPIGPLAGAAIDCGIDHGTLAEPVRQSLSMRVG
jgi:hypothetical protein